MLKFDFVFGIIQLEKKDVSYDETHVWSSTKTQAVRFTFEVL